MLRGFFIAVRAVGRAARREAHLHLRPPLLLGRVPVGGLPGAPAETGVQNNNTRAMGIGTDHGFRNV